MTREVRALPDANRLMRMGIGLARLKPVVGFGTVEDWILAALDQSPAMLPPALMADVGALLTGASLEHADKADLSTTMIAESPLRAAVRRAEDAVLARIASDVHLAALVDAITRLSTQRAAAIGLLLAQVASRLGAVQLPGESQPRYPLFALPSGAIRSRAALVEDDPDADAKIVDWLIEGYESITQAARSLRSLCTQADVFYVQNFKNLPGLGDRRAVSQVLELAEVFQDALPYRIAQGRVPEGSTPTLLDDESAYPTGGFSSVSTVGSLENLVSSELIYMEDAAGRARLGNEADLFELRYVEGELLYYTRDEALFVRRRRVVVIVLHPSLVSARFKDEHAPTQRIVLAIAAIQTVITRMLKTLGEEDLVFHIWALGDPTRSLEPELRLLRIVLRELEEAGTATVRTGPLADVLPVLHDEQRRARTQVLTLACEPFVMPRGEARDPACLDRRIAEVPVIVGAQDLAGWCETTELVLRGLL